MGRSISSGTADGLQDLRTMRAESNALESKRETERAKTAERAALRKIDELNAQLQLERGTLAATRALLISMRDMCLEASSVDALQMKRKECLQGARKFIRENFTDAEKHHIRRACTSIDPNQYPAVYELVPPVKPTAEDPDQFEIGEITETVEPHLLVFTKTSWIFRGESYKSEKLAMAAQARLVQKHAENLDTAKAQFRIDLAAIAKWDADFSDCVIF